MNEEILPQSLIFRNLLYEGHGMVMGVRQGLVKLLVYSIHKAIVEIFIYSAMGNLTCLVMLYCLIRSFIPFLKILSSILPRTVSLFLMSLM